MKTAPTILLSLLGVFPAIALAVNPLPAKTGRPPIVHEIREIEGWKIHVDVRLLGGEDESLGRQSLRVLGDKLHQIAMRLPADRVADLRKMPLFVDLDHPLTSMQYHPSARWLRRHNFDPAMTKAVHIPRADRLLRLIQTNQQPWVILHELAHAYHDRVLGFHHNTILKAYYQAKKSGRYESVLHNRGRLVRHYAMKNSKEYFAEMTEAYFGTNDFYPFVRAELERVDPATIKMLEEIWGKSP